MALSEEVLVTALLQNRARLLAYIWAIVRDSNLAEDVYQEVALLAVRKRKELQSAEALPVWLRRTARFQALAAVRDRNRGPLSLSDEVLDQIDQLWEDRDRQGQDKYAAALSECVGQLSPYAQQILSMRYSEGKSGKDVAKELDRKVRTIYVALTRIHRQLRECVETRIAEEDSDG